MLLGLFLALLVNLSHANLDKAGSQYSSNKFLITDSLYRKIGSKNAKNNITGSAKEIVIIKTTTLPSEDTTQSVKIKSNISENLPLGQEESDITPMHMIGNDNTPHDENNTEIIPSSGIVNHEHLIGQQHVVICDLMYEKQCGGSQCVQIFEGRTKCVLDLCSGTVLIACRNGQGCYTEDQRCDDIPDCEDSSDEMSCLSLVTRHDERHFYTRTVPFMAILCLMGIAASFVLYHQTNAARQRQRHLSMVGLTNALTNAGIAQGVERPLVHRSWRIPDGPETGLLRDFGDHPLEAVGFTTQQLEHLGSELQDYNSRERPNSIHNQCQSRSNSFDNQPWNDRELARQTFGEQNLDYFGRCVYLDSRNESSGAPPPYESALEMMIIKQSSPNQYNMTQNDTTSYGDPPPYESVSHIRCTSVPVTDI